MKRNCAQSIVRFDISFLSYVIGMKTLQSLKSVSNIPLYEITVLLSIQILRHE